MVTLTRIRSRTVASSTLPLAWRNTLAMTLTLNGPIKPGTVGVGGEPIS
jgi:hypothetical protein